MGCNKSYGVICERTLEVRGCRRLQREAAACNNFASRGLTRIVQSA
jgi:hypothetical protein